MMSYLSGALSEGPYGSAPREMPEEPSPLPKYPVFQTIFILIAPEIRHFDHLVTETTSAACTI